MQLLRTENLQFTTVMEMFDFLNLYFLLQLFSSFENVTVETIHLCHNQYFVLINYTFLQPY